jgi:hypothetical protein
MFETEQQARAYFVTLVASHPNIEKRIGDHLAEIPLVKAHGVQTMPDQDGHFDLHEYVNADLAPAATVIGPL